MTKFTVFTPTYNREKTLPRVYASLLRQNYKNFLWLIIDDGSTNGTRHLVEGWQRDALIEIEYHHNDHFGKHTAMRMAFDLCKTKYITCIDSDDALVPEALETFHRQWTDIENSKLESDIAEIRANCKSQDGTLFGNYKFPPNLQFIDSSWHTMVLKNSNDDEHVSCWDLQKVKNAIGIDADFWLSERLNFIPESVFWARLGKAYKTRYLTKALRIYYCDATDSLQRRPKEETHFYSEIVGYKYFLDENINYFFWRPRYFINMLLKLGVCSFMLKIDFLVIYKQIKTLKLRLFFTSFYPLSALAFFYFRYIKKHYWMQ